MTAPCCRISASYAEQCEAHPAASVCSVPLPLLYFQDTPIAFPPFQYNNRNGDSYLITLRFCDNRPTLLIYVPYLGTNEGGFPVYHAGMEGLTADVTLSLKLYSLFRYRQLLGSGAQRLVVTASLNSRWMEEGKWWLARSLRVPRAWLRGRQRRPTTMRQTGAPL